MFTPQELCDIPVVLSAPRFATYFNAAGQDTSAALDLYLWNAQISAAFLLPLQLCEIAVRNGVVDVVEAVHGPNWPWSKGFAQSLPEHRRGYGPAADLRNIAARHSSPGLIVAELKFAFWQSMFTKGQDTRLWHPHFALSFPGYDTAISISEARALMHHDIDLVRRFRNRIAHHEPIFARNLVTEYERIRQLVEWRRPSVAAWLDKVETVSSVLKTKP